MSNIWFTADTHFGHKNVIKYSKRPFDSVEEMNEKLIQNWNDVVSKKDNVYHLGDFALTNDVNIQSILKRLNGNIHLILGNHDKLNSETKSRFCFVKHYYELKSIKPNIILCHYAMRTWNKAHYGTWMLYGHSHGSLPEFENMKSTDVGVDCHPEYRPFNYDEIKFIMDQRQNDKIPTNQFR